jgi:hypothetical protein
MNAKLGPPTSLEDFERKAQLMNYETHRAIFEGMNQELWTKSSGRMLWMTQPAWPSTMWQILSHDYDTHAAFYGTKAASEQVHVQMSLADRRLAVVNNAAAPIVGAVLKTRVYDLGGNLADERGQPIDVAAFNVALGGILPLDLARTGPVIVKLDLVGADGTALSQNLYWLSGDAAASRKLASMPDQAVSLTASQAPAGQETLVTATLVNTGSAPALTSKLTLVDARGQRILPAYYSDNYVSLLPGERRQIEIRYPATSSKGAPRIELRGWNVKPLTVGVR